MLQKERPRVICNTGNNVSRETFLSIKKYKTP